MTVPRMDDRSSTPQNEAQAVAPRLVPAPAETSIRNYVRDLAADLLVFVANRIAGKLPGHRLRLAYYRRALGWKIGKGSSIHYGLKIYGGRGRVRIGNHSTFQIDCLIAGTGLMDLVIGDNVAIAYRVTIILGGHDPASPTFGYFLAPITIQDRVFIGANATILAGVTLGEGTIVGAGAVVTKSTPPYSIVAGNPARIIGERPRNMSYTVKHFWRFH